MSWARPLPDLSVERGGQDPLRKLEQLIDFNEAQAAAILKRWIHEGERA